ncbi:hypothetical protein [Bacillus cereus]|uniref:hypothetical protein n=1 Tax=Bacillus cereus TaxID=1396 RepID=UPI00387F1B3C
MSSFDTTLTIRPYNQELPYVGKTYTHKGQQVTVSKINKMEWVYTDLKVHITVENTDISNDDIEIAKEEAVHGRIKLHLVCGWCEMKFVVTVMSELMDVAYCPHCGECGLEYADYKYKQDGNRYEYRQNNWFYKVGEGDVWSVVLREKANNKEFVIDIQGVSNEDETYEKMKEFLEKKNYMMPYTILNIRQVGRALKIVKT